MRPEPAAFRWQRFQPVAGEEVGEGGGHARSQAAGPAQGEILLWQDRSGAVLGYGVLCAGFSLEQGGAFGLIDELFLKPQARGRGLGRAMLETLARHAGDRGWATVRLEVNRHNAAARRMYLAAGFRDEARDLLTRAAGAGA